MNRTAIISDIHGNVALAVTARFGVDTRPAQPIQWLSDHGSIYTALDTVIEASRLNLETITPPHRARRRMACRQRS